MYKVYLNKDLFNDENNRDLINIHDSFDHDKDSVDLNERIKQLSSNDDQSGLAEFFIDLGVLLSNDIVEVKE